MSSAIPFGLSFVSFLLVAFGAFAGSFEQVWHDDFEGQSGSQPDRAKWMYDIGYGNVLWGNNEWQTYTDKTENVRQDGMGHLVISARRDANGKYTSGRLKTKSRFAQRFGRFEARIKVPRGPGLLPAFWMMGNVGQWPANGEIDIMENVGSSPRTVFSNIHAPGYALPSTYSIDSELSVDFHVYGIEWTPGRISWLLDGKTYRTMVANDIPTGARWIFDEQPFYMLLNVAIGGDWPGKPVDEVLPQDMLIDWVRVSSYNP